MNANDFIERGAGEAMSLLNVLVMYEDMASGGQATALINRIWGSIFGPLGIESGLNLNLWRFDMLEQALVRKQAAVQAAIADVIMLSVNRKIELSADELEWLALWRAAKEDRPYLFCLVLGPEWDGRAAQNPLVAEMQNFTKAAKADFSCGLVEASSPRQGGMLEDFPYRANRLASVLDGILVRNLN